jgi:nucleoside-diphosphate-sugar epimerase
VEAHRVLVTGASGFTGRHLCERLAGDGHEVRVIDRNPARAHHWRDVGVDVVIGDIVEFEVATRATRNIDKVYHLAALFRQEGVPREAFRHVNVTGTRNLLEASVRSGVQRFIHCSTVGVHGVIDSPPANEDAPYRPGDHYQRSKMEGERVALHYMQRGGMAVTVFRPAGIYGPGDLRFLKLFKAINSGRFWMIGTGEVFYHLVYIDDLIDGILLCGSTDEAAGEIYILAGEEYVTLNVLTSLIAEVLGVPPTRRRVPVWPVYAVAYLTELVCALLRVHPPLYRRRVDFFRKNRAFDTTKARKELGFNPQIDLRTGLQRTAGWYRARGYL